MLPLEQYAHHLRDPREREAVLAALHEAATVPVDPKVLDDVDARYGLPDGTVDVYSYVCQDLQRNEGSGEFRALMQAAALVRIVVAYKQIETPEGLRFIRLTSEQ